jgi:hypothetical protein
MAMSIAGVRSGALRPSSGSEGPAVGGASVVTANLASRGSRGILREID